MSATATTPAPAATAASLPPELVAVITAAIHLTVGPSLRIVSIMPAESTILPQLLAWSHEGRRDHYASHRFR